jgi:SAM-dependent methyltransferase
MKIQHSNATKYNRYPRIFQRVSEYINASGTGAKVLSFGCSSGEEIATLDELYVSQSTIVGVDVDLESIAKAREKVFTGKNKIEIYGPSEDEWKSLEYDVVLALSVLCNWPDSQYLADITPLYRFNDFEAQTQFLASLVRSGGILVIHNSSFYFEDTNTYKTQFRPIHIDFDYLGEVKKFDSSGREYLNTRVGSNFFRKL